MNPDKALSLTGKVVVITGGVSGIGAGIAVRFLSAGATVVACSRRKPANLPCYESRTLEYFECDVRKAESCQLFVESVFERHGRLDALINNAGGSLEMDSATALPNVIENIIQLNLIGAFFMSQAAHRVMTRQNSGGSIINICSVSAIRASPYTAAYGAAKAGLVNLTETLAMEWGPQNIRVNALIDVANACLFLCSSLADYVSGAKIAVHGGGEKPIFLDLARDK